MSDANHIWRYGYPDRENITSYDKVQILTHRLHGVSRDMITLKTISPLGRRRSKSLSAEWIMNARTLAEYKEWFMEHTCNYQTGR